MKHQSVEPIGDSDQLVAHLVRSAGPRVVPDAERFDVGRSNASAHMSYGYGPHYCVGAALARQEMASGFAAVLDRLGDIALARPVPQPAHDPSFFLRPLKELHITFRRLA